MKGMSFTVNLYTSVSVLKKKKEFSGKIGVGLFSINNH